jgi:hypothetical protein
LPPCNVLVDLENLETFSGCFAAQATVIAGARGAGIEMLVEHHGRHVKTLPSASHSLGLFAFAPEQQIWPLILMTLNPGPWRWAIL